MSKHLIHKNSKEINKVPLTIDIEYGEIAINYHKGEETLFIKNDGGEIVPMPLKGGGGSGDIDILAIGFMTTLNDKYTGLADYYGLRKIGWTYEDIFYYQKHGVNWNREDDHLHKVPQNNIDLYGVINASNIHTYGNILVYLPKIDTSTVTEFNLMFVNCRSLTSIPLIDTSQGVDFNQMFFNCSSLTTIPLIDTSNGTVFDSMFVGCQSLTSIPLLNISQGTNFNYMFNGCTSLTSIPLLDTSQGTNFDSMFNGCTSLTSIPLLDTSNGEIFNNMFHGCTSLTSIPLLDINNGRDFGDDMNANLMFQSCSILSEINLKGLPIGIDLHYINKVTIKKKSILYIINNSIATSAITIRLDTNNYAVYSVDADVIAALALKPFVTLAK